MGWRRVSQGTVVGDEVKEGPDHRDFRDLSLIQHLVQMRKRRPRE